MERTKDIAQTTTSRSGADVVSPEERVAIGKALRDKIPHEQHGLWTEGKRRPNPIDLLHKADTGRMKKLIPIRYGRMLSRMDPLRVWYAKTKAVDFIESLPKALRKSVRKRIEETTAHSGSEFDFPKLARPVGGQIRITDQPPLIFHPNRPMLPNS